MAWLVLHSLRGFPVTDFAAHLPIEVHVGGLLRSEIPGRFWYCPVDPAVVCVLGQGVERDHIHPDLLSADRGALSLVAVVLSPVAANRVLQPGLVDFPVHVAAVLDPAVGVSGEMDPSQVGYLGCAVVDDAAVAGGRQALLAQEISSLRAD